MGQRSNARRRSAVESLEVRTLFAAPNDPLYDQDGLGTNIGLNAAYETTTGSPNVVIAIIDSGLDVTHPDIAPNLFSNPGEVAGDGIDNDANGYVDDTHGWDFLHNDNVTDDLDGHGTHVAGTAAAAGNNGIGISGVAQNAKLLAIKIGDITSVSFEAAIDGLQYLAQMKRAYVESGGTRGANVVVANGSFGGFDFPYNRDFDRAIADAEAAGILFVVAAGNDAINGDPNPVNPAKFSASLANVITVAATDRNDELASFTNVGAQTVQVAAPGVAVLSTYALNVDGDSNGRDDDGDGSIDEPDEDGDGLGPGYEELSGTSMASPVVAGTIALMASADPTASPAELKQALFDSVDILPSLDRPNALPQSVLTGGRVNAFRAVRGILNHYVKTDVATQGNWQGSYGSEGRVIAGEVDAGAPGVVVAVAGAEVVARPSRNLLQALEVPGSTARTLAQFQAADQFDVNVTVPNGTHRLTLYFAEFDRRGRSQRIELFDAATGAKLNERTVSSFAKGTYVTFDVTGAVVARVSRVAGANVVLNGAFVDPTGTSAASFRGLDTTTGGNWRKRYDADGAVIIGRTDFPAAGMTGTISGAQTEVIAASTNRPGALVLPGEARRGSVGYLRTASTATVGLTFAEGQAHQVSVYAVDFDRKRRAQRVELLDAGGNVIDGRELSNFTGGQYLTWEVVGPVTIRLTRLHGPDAVLSGIFVDQVSRVAGHYVGQDATTHGSWQGEYGLDEMFVPGHRNEETLVNAGALAVSQTGGTLRVVTPITHRENAVQFEGDHRTRIAAHLETRNEMNLTLNLGDGPVRRVSFYAADFENRRRAQTVEVYDVATDALLARTDMVAFRDGHYATFDLTGDVRVRILNTTGNDGTAVLSGVFFD